MKSIFQLIVTSVCLIASVSIATAQSPTVAHNTWSSGAPIPTPVAFASAAVLKNQIYVVGGYPSDSYSGAVADTQIYNPVTNAWSSGTAMPTGTAQAAAAVVKNVLYVFGGTSDDCQTPSNAVWAFNPKTNTWTSRAAMPTSRCSIAATVENNIIYVIGGFNPGSGRLNTVEAYNPKTNKWTEEAPLLVGKSEPSVGLVGTKATGFTIVAADGYTSSGQNGDNEGYDAATNVWTSLAPDPTGRNGACGSAIGSLMYIAGGLDANGNSLTLNEAFKVSNNTWTTLSSMPQAALVPAAAAYKKRLYCISGWVANPGALLNNVQIYQP